MTEQFRFSDEERRAIMAALDDKDETGSLVNFLRLAGVIERIEDAVNHAREGDAIGTIRRSPKNWVHNNEPARGSNETVFAIKTDQGWVGVYPTTGEHYLAAASSLLVARIHEWPRIYLEAES